MTNDAQASLQGQVAIVTGAAGGIGRATAKAFARAGADLVLSDRDAEALASLAESIQNESGSKVSALAADVTSEKEMNSLAETAFEQFGKIDVLVTCAGILRGPGQLPHPVSKVEVNEWQAVIDINLKGVYLINRAVLKVMVQARNGLIINVSSTSGLTGKANDGPYCASKFGVRGLTQSIAEEVRPYGIRAQAIFPDAVDTPLWEQNGPIKPEHALPPERVADLLLFMASLPADTLLVEPVIAPFRTRKRRKKKPAADAGNTGTK